MKDEPSFFQSRIVGLIRQGHMTGKEVATLRAQLNDVRDELRDAQKQLSEPSSLRADFGDMCLRIQELSQENAELGATLRETGRVCEPTVQRCQTSKLNLVRCASSS